MKIKEWLKKFGLVKMEIGSGVKKYGLPIIRTNKWDYYDPSQLK